MRDGTFARKNTRDIKTEKYLNASSKGNKTAYETAGEES